MGAYSRDVGTRLRITAPNRVIDRYVGYDSIPGGAYTYEQTRDNGLTTARAALAQAAKACPNAKFAVFGYSMGADIGARLAQEIGQGKGPIPADRLTSAVLMANPNRGVPGVQQAGGAGATEGAYGALPGGYGSVTNRVLDICRAGDIVCDTRDSGRLLAQVFAQTAILALKLPVDQLNANVAKLPPQEQINFYTQLPANALGTILHTDYYTVNGSGLATDYITSHLA
ncbi:cutinase family protein [Corynebacterium heidelbergense]|nr:cutinase family protein [Corynebacterium heidelbergense]